MTIRRLPYGRGFLDVDVSPPAAAGHAVEAIAPRTATTVVDPIAEVESALAGCDLPPYRGGGCVIAINDDTRPVPHEILLPCLLRRLERGGVAADHIRMVIAGGTHPPMPPEQFTEVVPRSILERYRVIAMTPLGTRADVARGDAAWHADLGQSRVSRGGAADRGRSDRAAPVRRFL
jgi:hypothetical protein